MGEDALELGGELTDAKLNLAEFLHTRPKKTGEMKFMRVVSS